MHLLLFYTFTQLRGCLVFSLTDRFLTFFFFFSAFKSILSPMWKTWKSQLRSLWSSSPLLSVGGGAVSIIQPSKPPSPTVLAPDSSLFHSLAQDSRRRKEQRDTQPYTEVPVITIYGPVTESTDGRKAALLQTIHSRQNSQQTFPPQSSVSAYF